ncbi:MAG: DinB family protein [Bacteroidota bacterium]
MEQRSKFQEEFIGNSCFRMEESLRMIRISLDTISEEEVWQKPNPALNSIGNLILHLCGNITQYGIASLRGSADERNRDSEFAMQGGISKEKLFAKLYATVEEAKATFRNTKVNRLLEQRKVQGFTFSGIGNIVHVVEHFSYHTGQIAFLVKLLREDQLGFYDGHDLNQLNNE